MDSQKSKQHNAAKSILLIGGQGFLGLALQKRLTSKQDVIFNIDNMKSENANFLYMDFSMGQWQNPEFEKFICNLPRLDGIVFLAGIMEHNSVFDISAEKWRRLFRVNLESFVFLIRELISHCNESASIVVVASQNGVMAHKNRLAYGASKAALIQCVKDLQADFYDNQVPIRINAVSPGYIERHWSEQSLELVRLRQRMPNGEFVNVDDVAEVIAFLLNNKSKGIQGQNVLVDNGYSIL